MRDSRFCLCPSGWGYGWRLYLAMATLCIPVIIQPMIEQVSTQAQGSRRLRAGIVPSLSAAYVHVPEWRCNLQRIGVAVRV